MFFNFPRDIFCRRAQTFDHRPLSKRKKPLRNQAPRTGWETLLLMGCLQDTGVDTKGEFSSTNIVQEGRLFILKSRIIALN